MPTWLRGAVDRAVADLNRDHVGRTVGFPRMTLRSSPEHASRPDAAPQMMGTALKFALPHDGVSEVTEHPISQLAQPSAIFRAGEARVP